MANGREGLVCTPCERFEEKKMEKRKEAASRLFIGGRNAKLVSPGKWQDVDGLIEITLPEGMVIDQVVVGHDHYVIIDGMLHIMHGRVTQKNKKSKGPGVFFRDTIKCVRTQCK